MIIITGISVQRNLYPGAGELLGSITEVHMKGAFRFPERSDKGGISRLGMFRIGNLRIHLTGISRSIFYGKVAFVNGFVCAFDRDIHIVNLNKQLKGFLHNYGRAVVVVAGFPRQNKRRIQRTARPLTSSVPRASPESLS